MKKIMNPIIPGFHPDPSICRVQDDYYIATSTFEWYPGVRLHHSRDLVHWQFIGYVLTRTTQLNMIGNDDSCGVWAPCLTYDNGLFYCIFTDAKTFQSAYDDVHNYLVTAQDIHGPWSDPIYLNSSGFDPSLFHDDDGRKWLVNMICDHRMGKNFFAGIVLQEYSPSEKRLVGPITNIFSGTKLAVTEGPHLYKKDGYYYLFTAEGGTNWGHAVTVARSKSITGPYEVHPENPLLTARYDGTLPLQKAGHASVVQTQNNEWYMAYLCSRPLMPEMRCTLGRESAIQKLIWEQNQWPKLESGGKTPTLETPAPNLPAHPFTIHATNSYRRDDFNSPDLNPEFNSLRHPVDSNWCSLTEHPGFLRLYGRESLFSRHRQSLIARRITHFKTIVTTAVEFHPENFQQIAGLIFYYDTKNHIYLYLTHDDNKGRCLGLILNDCGDRWEIPEAAIPIKSTVVYLKGELDYREIQYYYATIPDKWIPIGRKMNASILSDDYCYVVGKFTGLYAGMCVQDLSGQRKYADFDWFCMEKKS